MALQCLKGDKDEDATRLCARWLKAADRMRTHLFESGNGFDPLRYNETATVGFLVAAAGRARMLALPEFTEDRETLPEGRVRAGRCDLWLASEDWEIEWLLEFKLCWYGPSSRRGLVSRLNSAIKCAIDRDKDEASDRWGVVVYCPIDKWYDEPGSRDGWKSPGRLARLANSVDMAFHLTSPAGPVYFLFKKLPRGARSAKRYQLKEGLLDD